MGADRAHFAKQVKCGERRIAPCARSPFARIAPDVTSAALLRPRSPGHHTAPTSQRLDAKRRPLPLALVVDRHSHDLPVSDLQHDEFESYVEHVTSTLIPTS